MPCLDRGTTMRDKDGPVVFVGDDEFQSIEVRVTVTNRGGDPSYATSVRVSYPEELLDLNTSSRDWSSSRVMVPYHLSFLAFRGPTENKFEAGNKSLPMLFPKLSGSSTSPRETGDGVVPLRESTARVEEDYVCLAIQRFGAATNKGPKGQLVETQPMPSLPVLHRRPGDTGVQTHAFYQSTATQAVSKSPTFPPKILAPMADVLTVKVKMSVNVTISGEEKYQLKQHLANASPSSAISNLGRLIPNDVAFVCLAPRVEFQEILPDAAYYSGNVTDGILVNNGENKIGATRLLVRVRVQNLRKHSLVPNSRLVIDWPYETADVVNEENGKFLFYLLEKPYVTKTEFPTSANTTIVCDSRALDKLVNPYGYRVFKSLRPQPRGDPVATAHVDLPPNHPTKYPQLKSKLEIDEMPDQGNVKRFTTRLSCYNGQLRCVPIVCDLGPLSYRAGAVSFEMPARLWDNTMRQDFKDVFMTAVQITVTWRASVTYTIDMGDTDHASNSFELKIFNDMEPEPVYPKNMPLYIGLAVFAGLLLLSILVIVLWKAKFFERKKFKRRFQRTKPASEGPKQPSPESQHLNSPGPSLQRPVNIHFAGERHVSLHSPPISAYDTMNS
ncbi:unnamed protein product [Mesocestoides corti]|uniref:Integrin alpha third immunoglobulin-like domain-containing protein n=1 Tax=Mesocestoides corti TaxID=53468 RepID=A0A0R3UAF1_MESCO|nr:unnamed protein product [Mesocestoides corti]